MGPWQAVEDESDSSSDEKEYLSSVLQKAQASLAEDTFHSSSTSNVDSDDAFVRVKSVSVDIGSVPVSVIQRAKRSQDAAVGIPKTSSFQEGKDFIFRNIISCFLW